jgi:hypothetical protein
MRGTAMMIETLESREFCSATPGFSGGVIVAAGDVNGDGRANSTATRIVVVQPTSTTPQPSPNVVISIIGVLFGL